MSESSLQVIKAFREGLTVSQIAELLSYEESAVKLTLISAGLLNRAGLRVDEKPADGAPPLGGDPLKSDGDPDRIPTLTELVVRETQEAREKRLDGTDKDIELDIREMTRRARESSINTLLSLVEDPTIKPSERIKAATYLNEEFTGRNKLRTEKYRQSNTKNVFNIAVLSEKMTRVKQLCGVVADDKAPKEIMVEIEKNAVSS